MCDSDTCRLQAIQCWCAGMGLWQCYKQGKEEEKKMEREAAIARKVQPSGMDLIYTNLVLWKPSHWESTAVLLTMVTVAQQIPPLKGSNHSIR